MSQEEMITGNVALNVKGIPLEFEMSVPANPVKSRRLLPIFQQMANAMVEAGVDMIERQGKKISCKPHCGACCRQAVPITEMEVYHIAELVENLPEPRRTEIKKRFAEAAEHFTKIGWYERLREFQSREKPVDPSTAAPEWIGLILEYFHQGVACPFLEDESCSIHPDRPVSCREYMVTSAAKDCADPSPETVKVVELILKPSTALQGIARSPNYQKYGLPILTRALEMAQTYPENSVEKPGPEWMRDFFVQLSGKELPKNVEDDAS